MKTVFALLFVFGVALTGLPRAGFAQIQPTESFGRYRDDSQDAADHFARGSRSKKKAEAESNPQKKQKYYLRAKEELSKAVAFSPSFDHLLALGQVYLGLGQKKPAFDTCSQALARKPGNPAAQECQESAKALKEETTPEPGLP
jgi:tetratricopeptide (TPR) repeat protein